MAADQADNTSRQTSRRFEVKPAEDGRLVVELQDLQIISPIPPAAEMQKLAEILPDGPERVLKMAERALAHKIELAEKSQAVEAYLAKTSLWVAAFIAALGLSASTLLVLNGQALVGTIFGGGTLLGIITCFVSVVSEKKISTPKTPPDTLNQKET